MNNKNYEKEERKHYLIKTLIEMKKNGHLSFLQQQLLDKYERQDKEINRLHAINVEIIDDLLTNLEKQSEGKPLFEIKCMIHNMFSCKECGT